MRFCQCPSRGLEKQAAGVPGYEEKRADATCCAFVVDTSVCVKLALPNFRQVRMTKANYSRGAPLGSGSQKLPTLTVFFSK